MHQTEGSPKFMVVEIESKEDAVRLVQVMVNNGFPRLSLLDDLGKHPALKDRPSRYANHQNQPLQHQRPNESHFVSNPVHTIKNEYTTPEDYFESMANFDDQSVSLDCMIQNYPPTSTSTFDEEYESNMSTTGEEAPRKKMRIDNEHHQCQLCGARVKMYGGARWSLQMHVIAVHSKDKIYKCQKCEYQDYRKRMMPRHGLAAHGEELDAVNVVNDEKRSQWDHTMSQCFPLVAEKCNFAKFFN